MDARDTIQVWTISHTPRTDPGCDNLGTIRYTDTETLDFERCILTTHTVGWRDRGRIDETTVNHTSLVGVCPTRAAEYRRRHGYVRIR